MLLDFFQTSVTTSNELKNVIYLLTSKLLFYNKFLR